MKILLEKKKKLMRVAPKIQKVWDKKKDCCLVLKTRSVSQFSPPSSLAVSGVPGIPECTERLSRPNKAKKNDGESELQQQQQQRNCRVQISCGVSGGETFAQPPPARSGKPRCGLPLLFPL